jgi:hypothetical protein
MVKPFKKIRLRIDGPCPCGGGKAIQACHLDFDGRFRREVPCLRPPGMATGFSHKSCYLRDTRDCSQDISREHYISRSVLEQLGELLRVSGVPWLEPGETFDTLAGSLTAKILCKRHNEALSPLDDEAGRFFSILTGMLIDLNRKTLSRKPMLHLVSGEALELWMLKVACGLYFAVGAKDRVKIAENNTIDMAKVRRAFFDREWDPQAGLYYRGAVGTVIDVADNIGFSPLTMDLDRRFAGAVVSLRGFTLKLIFDTTNVNRSAWSDLVRRPSELVFHKANRRHTIILTWPPGVPEAAVTMTERRRRIL